MFSAPQNVLLGQALPLYYDPLLARKLFSFWLLKHPRTLCRVAARFFKILNVFIQVLFFAWADGQVWTYLGQPDPDRAQVERRKRHALWLSEQMLGFGPTFIKVGQSLSTRVDLLRKELIDALAGLQDRVPSFNVALARQTIEEELGKPIDQLFERFDNVPLAAASLGQVHLVTLLSGEEIIIKIQRPNLLVAFYLDLAILRGLAYFVEHHTELGRGREWVGVVDTFGKTLFEEIDYRTEATNAERFYQLLHGKRPEPGVRIHIPQIYRRFTTRRVLGMEYAPGIKVNDILGLDKAGVNREHLALAAVKSYFQQLLVHGLYHADPHPGNLAVMPPKTPGGEASLIFYDFGMVGEIGEKMRLAIVDTFLNIIQKKPDRILNNLLDLDMIAPNADLELMRQVITWGLDNYYDVPHDQLNFEQLTEEIADLMYAHPFKLPPNFTLMIRAMLTLEGVATTLYPGIRFMTVAVDYAQAFLQKTLSLKYVLRKGAEWLGLDPDVFEGLLSGSSRKRLPRVRLQPDEWTPLARYVKLGLGLLGLGQAIGLLLMATCFVLLAPPEVWLHLTPFKQSLGVGILSLWVVLNAGVMALLAWLPAQRKLVRFQPTVSSSKPLKTVVQAS